MKTWVWCVLSGLATAFMLSLALLLWLGHGWLAQPSALHRQLQLLRDGVHYSTVQTYGQLDPHTQRNLAEQSAALWQTLDQRRDKLPLNTSSCIAIANSSVMEWLRRPSFEPLRQQAVRDLDRALAATP